MAGINYNGEFPEKVSPFLKSKIELVEELYGKKSQEYLALALQYYKSSMESNVSAEVNDRHWHADVNADNDKQSAMVGVERLYQQSVVIEPTMICAAHCRYCLRANYNIFTLADNELEQIAKYCGSDALQKDVSEVLITGGDPLIVPHKLMYLVSMLAQHAKNVKRIRIGTRLILHDPGRIDNNIYEIFHRFKDRFQFEIATQVNHSIELFPEVSDVLSKIRDMGIPIYSQNVLLKGVNDQAEILVDLYQKLRDLNISPHYLFHSVPMRGMHHLRTSVSKGLRLINELVNSGRISGRIKPMYALMTDIGKITLYENVILDRNEHNEILLQSKYNYTDRMKWNPMWEIPQTAKVDKEGYLQVWYLDGED